MKIPQVLMLTDHLDESCIQKLADYEGNHKAEESGLNVKALEVGEVNDLGKGINERDKGNHKEPRRLAGTKALALPRAPTRIHRALVVFH